MASQAAAAAASGSSVGNSRIPDGVHVWCKYEGDGTWREAEVVAWKASNRMYYIHYMDFNRRMDAWVHESNINATVNPDDPNAVLRGPIGTNGQMKKSATMESQGSSGSAGGGGGAQKKADKNNLPHERGRKLVIGNEEKEVVEFVEEEYGESAGMDEESIREHEEVTKIKNVNKIELGRNSFDTWYYSPIPREYFPDGPIDVLYFCEFTLNFYAHKSDLIRHYSKLKIRYPPGDEIYRDTKNGVAMFEVDGAKSKFYCQNLCYLAKFFLDHKTLHYDTDVFLFYVLCELDNYGYHIVGFFSKEKYSEQGNNLACILTLPPYQKKGYGSFLISFSYELSKKEGRVGSPEKPLSDLGQISYKSYWCRTILELLREYKGNYLSVMDMTRLTSIRTEDVFLALNTLGLLRHDISRSDLNLPVTPLDANLNGLSVPASILRSSSSASSNKRKYDEMAGSETEEEEVEAGVNAGDDEGRDNVNGEGKANDLPVIFAPPSAIETAFQNLSGKGGFRVDPSLLHWAPLKVDVRRDKWSISSKRRNFPIMP